MVVKACKMDGVSGKSADCNSSNVLIAVLVEDGKGVGFVDHFRASRCDHEAEGGRRA